MRGQRLDLFRLLLRQHFGNDFVDIQLLGHRFGRRCAVASEHDNTDAVGLQRFNGCGR